MRAPTLCNYARSSTELSAFSSEWMGTVTTFSVVSVRYYSVVSRLCLFQVSILLTRGGHRVVGSLRARVGPARLVVEVFVVCTSSCGVFVRS